MCTPQRYQVACSTVAIAAFRQLPVELIHALLGAFAVGRAGQGFGFQLHQALGRKAHYLVTAIRYRNSFPAAREGPLRAAVDK
jgi:hypothetical protein